MTTRCTATCRDGSPCRGPSIRGSDPPRCAAHGSTRQRCTAISLDGSPCRRWPVRGTDPPLCPSHGGRGTQRCSATCRDGSPCGRSAVANSDPPLCPGHGDRSNPCTATRHNGSPCRQLAIPNRDPPLCHWHSTNARRCTATRRDGSLCEGVATPGTAPPRCPPHSARRNPCTASTPAGSPCMCWAMDGTDPPVCAAHGGTSKQGSAPPGNQFNLRHGFFAQPQVHRPDALPPGTSIDDAIAELYRRHLRLNAYLQEVVDGGGFSPAHVVHLLRLHSRSIYRMVRLLRVRRARTPTPDDVLQAAINQALDELSEDLGVEL